MMRCLIVTLGGDAPGVNAIVRSVARLALHKGLEVWGAKQGWVGLLRGRFVKLRETDVGNILGKGGSVLGSTDLKIAPDDTDSLGAIAKSLSRFDLVVATGGMGSFAVLNRVYSSGALGVTTTMFVPSSVENEFLDPLRGRDGYEGRVHGESVGADTAANTAVLSVDRLREQAHHSRTVFLVECVGLKSNFLPIQIGLACGAHRIYLPPWPQLPEEELTEIREFYGSNFHPNHVDIPELVQWIETMFEESRRRYLVVVLPHGVPLLRMAKTEESTVRYEERITSMNPLELTVLRVADALSVHFSGPNAVQVRYVLLDDLQKGGAPSLRDRVLGSLYGEAAVEEYLALLNGIDTKCRGNLNLLVIGDTSRVAWQCFPRHEVSHLFQGDRPRAGGLDPLPFFRQARGTISGYRALANL